MRLLITFISILLFNLAFSQDKQYILTDSSRIEVEKSILGNTTTYEYLTKKNIVHYLFQNKKGITEIQGQYDTDKTCIGVWTYFSEQGELIRSENYDNRVWTIHAKKWYPFKTLLDSIKAKADSIVIATYGKEFFSKNLKWNFQASYYYFDEYNGNSWTDTTLRKPVSFLFCYDIQFDQTHFYKSMVEFELDKDGLFKGDGVERVFGFEQVPLPNKHAFTLTTEKALAIAKHRGLVETDSTTAETSLEWESNRSEDFYNGKFRYYVFIKTSTSKKINPNPRLSNTIYKYDVYVIDPWTSKFVEKKKMKIESSWDTITELLPDN